MLAWDPNVVRVGSYRLSPAWGQIAFASALFGWIAWYYFDALAASPNVQNLLLIRPAAIVATILYVIIVWQCLHLEPFVEDRPAPLPRGSARGILHPDFRPAILAGLLVLHLAGITFVGFDVSTFLFITLTMLMSGERRPHVVLLVAGLFSVLVTLFFQTLLSVPINTLLM